MMQRPVTLSVGIFVVFLLMAAPAGADRIGTGAEARRAVQPLLAGRTPPLKVGTIREVGQRYEVEVVTPRGTLVDRLLVEKATGRVRSLYGQTLLSLGPTQAPGSALAPGGSGAFPKVSGGTMAMSQAPGQDPATAAHLLTTMNRMLHLMERLLERTHAPADGR